MRASDRRLGFRIPLEIFLNQYIRDEPFRALTANLSDTGLFVQTVKPMNDAVAASPIPIGLEFELPGTGETIWARGEICYQRHDSYTFGAGIRFVAMAGLHARMLRDFCVESRRAHLGRLLERIRNPAAA